MSALLVAVLLCAAGAAAEGLLAGKGPQGLLRSLRQPAWSLPMTFWYFIAIVYYSACFLAAYRMALRDKVVSDPAFWGLLALMAANAVWNGLFFRRRDFRASFLLSVPYAALVAGLTVGLLMRDAASAIGLVVYSIYLPYGLAWNWSVWKLNR